MKARYLIGLALAALLMFVAKLALSSRSNEAAGMSVYSTRERETDDRTKAPVSDITNNPASDPRLSSGMMHANEPEESAAPARTPLDEVRDDISEQVDLSLDGLIEVNRLITKLGAIAELPIEKEVDFDFQDNDAVAYKFIGTPEGTTAHFLVGIASFSREGKEFRSFEMEFQVGGNEVQFHRGFMREGPRVRLLMDYDEEGNMGRMGLVATRRVSLGDSRRAGIDAYQGEFTNGVSYVSSLTNPEDHSSETIGVQNGQDVTSMTNPPFTMGIKPLSGDVQVNLEKARALFEKLQARLATLNH